MRNQFVFQHRDHPTFFHYGWKEGTLLNVEWDAAYKAANPLVMDTAYLASVARQYVESGEWIILGAQRQESKLAQGLLALRMGFDALEESFKTLSAEFERLRRVERMA